MDNSYKVKAISPDGAIFEDVIQAKSETDAISILRTRGNSPISVVAQTSTVGSREISIKRKRVSVTDIANFCKQLSTMLDAGLPLDKAIDILVEQTENKVFKEAIAQVSLQIKQGTPLSKAMKMQSNIFPDLLVSMIESGELTGNLDEVLGRLSGHYVKEHKINSKVKGAMIYPIILLILAVLMVSGMMIFVFPMMVGMLTEADVELPGITKFLIAVSDFMVANWFFLLVGIIVGVFFLGKYLKTEGGKRAFDKLTLKLPMTKGPISQIVTSRFTRTFSTLSESGIPIVKALQAATDTTNNMVLKDGMETVIIEVQAGKQLGPLLDAVGIFPPMMISMVSIGEETGALDELLATTADYYDEELDSAINRLVALIEPAMILIMGVVIGFILVSIMIPMFDMVVSGAD